ncbi:DUF3455 domain-containing protein [Aspergillus undulatus]|uniref:DUF3455 domain-containing protein n=1 Tax=Aspergillus undulatus TaxID=1810928 RepID=UPI003CCD7201
MIWTSPLSVLVAVLCITTVNALPTPQSASSSPSSSPSFYTSAITTFLQDLKLTNCALGPSTALPYSSLPPPSTGLTLNTITIGRGTQNYTCATSDSSSKPIAAGATANLFDASCLAALGTGGTGDLLHLVPDVLKPVPLSTTDLVSNILSRISGQNLEIGKHYFTAQGVPFFDLRRSAGLISGDRWIAAQKEAEAPAGVKPGYGLKGDVAWLKLKGVEGGLKEVYRVHTAGGSPPATCEGMDEVFTVDYTSEYWFYG